MSLLLQLAWDPIVLANVTHMQQGYFMLLAPKYLLASRRKLFQWRDSQIIVISTKPTKMVIHCFYVPSTPHSMATQLLDTFQKQRKKSTLYPRALNSYAKEWSQLKNEIPVNLMPLLDAAAENSFCLFIYRQQFLLLWLINSILFAQLLQKGEYYWRERIHEENK